MVLYICVRIKNLSTDELALVCKRRVCEQMDLTIDFFFLLNVTVNVCGLGVWHRTLHESIQISNYLWTYGLEQCVSKTRSSKINEKMTTAFWRQTVVIGDLFIVEKVQETELLIFCVL